MTTDDTRPLSARLSDAMDWRHHDEEATAALAEYDAERARHAALVEAAQQMWFAHTEDETFRPTGPLSTDPYGEFEDALRAAVLAAIEGADRD
jgi:hypothetical protein